MTKINPTFDPILAALDTFDAVLRIDEPHRKATEKATVTIDQTPLTRPNGELYFPRPFMDTTDVEFIKTAYANNLAVLLYGPPGTGKTALVEAVFPHCITVQGTAETESGDFVGGWTQNHDGNYEWADGPLAIAAENGIPLLIDEIALIDSRSLAVVYAMMDGRKTVPVPQNPARGPIVAKDGFAVFGACNPDVPGAIMSDALLSRFAMHVQVSTDWDLANAKLGISKKIISVARNLQGKYDVGQLVAAPQLRELINFRNIAMAFTEELALRNFIASARPEDRDVYISVASSVFTSATVESLVL